ncbi:MAG: hypothetical protein DRN81_03930 [Thermoproteota archaeon]|nr:MAG: hypothetical protein DRN81_03930 [Candidatus Korarchaeota archaeon]
MKINGYGRLDFIVRQRGRVILRIVHFDGLNLWFKQDSAGNVTAITEEKALMLVNAWMEHHEDAKANISGGLIHYLKTQEITNIEKRMQELKNEKSVAISGLVFCG